MKFYNKPLLNRIDVLRDIEYKNILSNKNIEIIANAKSIKIFFSKNDYKSFPYKKMIIDRLSPDMVITHTKKAVDFFERCGARNVIWLPFSISRNRFNQRKDKKYDLGFRANSNRRYNESIRDIMYKKLIKIESTYLFDLHICEEGECFLKGEKYIDWLSECRIIANSVSANGTVGPKFFEGIACNTISIAPKNYYEGLLVADVHYISVSNDFHDLKYKIDLYLNNKEYRNNIIREANQLLDQHTIERQYGHIMSCIN